MSTATGFRQGNLAGKVPDHTHDNMDKLCGGMGSFPFDL
jgi:hypothetical protein